MVFRTRVAFMLKKILLLALFGCCLSFLTLEVGIAKDKEKIPPAFVETVRVALTGEQPKVFATGNVVANPGIIVRPEVAGRITKVFFKPGEKVVVGTPLIEINPDIIKAQLARNQVDLQLKHLSYERSRQLYTTHTVSKEEYDNALAALNSAKELVEEMNARLRQTLLVASFSGRVGINLVNLGDYVNAGQDIVSLQALDPIYVDFSIPEIYVHKVNANQEISVTSESSPNEVFKGKVFAVDPLVDAKTRSVKVRALIPNPEEKLLPGTFVEVALVIGEQKQMVKIPQTAVVYDAAGNYVYKVINGHAKKTAVVLGERDGANILVKQGLVVGDTIVTAGQLRIAMDGAMVVVKQ